MMSTSDITNFSVLGASAIRELPAWSAFSRTPRNRPSMNHTLLRAALASYVLCSGAVGAAAQSSDAPVERPVVTAVRLEQSERIALDGRLSEPAWQRARPAEGFKQSDPRFGAPATEGTEIRVLFD